MEILKSYHFENYDFYFDVKTYYLDEVIGQPVEMQHGYGNTLNTLNTLKTLKTLKTLNTLKI